MNAMQAAAHDAGEHKIRPYPMRYHGETLIDQPPINESDIWQALRDVPDPEIPTVNLVDLGVILRVELDEASRRVHVLLLPTFTGCPAIAMMRDLIRERLEQLGL